MAKVRPKGEESLVHLLALARAGGRALGSIGKVPLPDEEEDTALKDLITMLAVGTATGTAELGGGLSGVAKGTTTEDERYPNPFEAWGKGFSRGVEGVQGGEKFSRARQAENLARARLGLPPAEEMWAEEMLLGMVPFGPKRPPHVPNVIGGEEIIESAGDLAKEIAKRRASRYRLETPEQARTAAEQLESTVSAPRVVDPRTQYLEEPEPMDRLNMLDRIIDDVRDAQTVEDLETGLIQDVAPISKQRVAELFPQERNVPEDWGVRNALGESTRQARLAVETAMTDLDAQLRYANELGVRTPEGREVYNEAYIAVIDRILNRQIDPQYIDPGVLDQVRYYVLNPRNTHGLSPETAESFAEQFLRPHRGLEHIVPPQSRRGANERGRSLTQSLIDGEADVSDLDVEDLQDAREYLDSVEDEITDAGREALDVIEEELGRRGAGSAELTTDRPPGAPRSGYYMSRVEQMYSEGEIDLSSLDDDILFDFLDRPDDFSNSLIDGVRAEAQSRGLIDENWQPRVRRTEEGLEVGTRRPGHLDQARIVHGVPISEQRLLDALDELHGPNINEVPTEDLEDLHTHIVNYIDQETIGEGYPSPISRLLDELEAIIEQRPPGPSPTTGQRVRPSLAERRATAPPEERRRLHEVDRQRYTARQQAFHDEGLLRRIELNRETGVDYADFEDDELVDFHDKLVTLMEGPTAANLRPVQREELATLMEEILAYLRERGL